MNAVANNNVVSARNLRKAYDQNLKDYLDTVPQLFHHNAFLLLANGSEAKVGALGGKYEHFHNWKRLEEAEPGVVDMETLLKGVCDKRNFLDLFENFVLFDDAGDRTIKIVARNHQFLGVNRALRAVGNRQQNLGKLGVFWHTQGSGKSYSMLFFTRKVHRRIGGNYTFLVVTDRDDLDGQIYGTYVGCGVVGEKEESRAASGTLRWRAWAIMSRPSCCASCASTRPTRFARTRPRPSTSRSPPRW